MVESVKAIDSPVVVCPFPAFEVKVLAKPVPEVKAVSVSESALLVAVEEVSEVLPKVSVKFFPEAIVTSPFRLIAPVPVDKVPLPV